jgi:hypothetical protein
MGRTPETVTKTTFLQVKENVVEVVYMGKNRFVDQVKAAFGL